MFGMNMGMVFGAEQHQTLRLTPALIALNNMLVLSMAEMQQLLEQELNENPALEQVEADESFCAICGHALLNQICPVCTGGALYEEEQSSGSGASDNGFDLMTLVAAPMSLHESLTRDLRASMDDQDHAFANYLVGCLDDRGFLDADLAETARAFGFDLVRAEAVLRKIQEIAPSGVGARNVQECLLIQFDQLEREGITHPHVRRIIRDFWDDLGLGRHTAIARAMRTSHAEVIAARDFIRNHLRPYPLDYSNDSGSGSSNTTYVLPDVLIRAEEDAFVVEVFESQRSFLRVSPLYQQLASAVRTGQEQVSEHEHEHLRNYLSRARVFLSNLRQRRETIRRISEYIVERQEDFLRYGVRHLMPLTRSEVACALGVHDSTVSRATANKFVQLPNRSIVSFDTFFTASLSVKDVLRAIIEREQRPLTDNELVELLRAEGVDIARRTVAKYRQQLGILPSTLR